MANLDDTHGDAHIRRLGALKRVFDHNTREAARPHSPLRWMVAIEVDLRFAVDVCKVWLQGEEGTMEGTVEFDFRFMSPSTMEAEFLRYRTTSGTG